MMKLALRDVRKTYDKKQVVHGVNLDVPAGAFVVIVGPSGCGKSTLLRMIAGLEDISDGEIAIDGARVNEREPSERGCAMVFQNYALYPHMTVAQNIEYPLKIAGVPRAERTRRMRETADILDLGDYLDRRPGQLSGGQRQRVAMGRAIVREPSIFLFDEPLSNLDAKLRVQMRIEIRRLHRRLGATSIFVTHDQVEAMTLADILVVMNNGKVEQIGSPSEVYRSPASTFVASFTGAPAMNLLPATVVEQGRATLDAWPDLPLAIPGTAPRGQRVIVGIRPEDVIVGPEASGALPVTLDLVEDTGGSMTGFFALGETEVAAVLEKHFSARSGEFGLQLPVSALSVFDLETGRRNSDESHPATAKVAVAG